MGKDEEAAGSEITLKGIWVDQVEGGVKNAASVYGLAQTVGFSVLPDLFFRVRADDRGLDKIGEKESFDAAVNKLVAKVDKSVKATTGFNDKVKEVLGRKLTQYYVWKLRTFKELKTRRAFTLKYLRQHYDTIKLYMGWIRPYLRNIQRLQMAEKLVRKDMADLITAFEGALVEIETLLYQDKGHGEWKPVVLLYLYYRTRPSLSYVQEGYQRGPMHTGRFDMILRGYVWHEDEIKNYQNMREVEDLELLGSMDVSIKQALESLGDELKDYLRESGEELEGAENGSGKKTEGEVGKAVKEATEPFTGVLAGIRELMSPLSEVAGLLRKKDHRKKKRDFVKDDTEVAELEEKIKAAVYQAYKNYKKMHGMMTW